jgi:RNA polymerase sigma factor (TIGR02999 family)
VYEQLREIAANQLGRELPGHTFTPTALVHEAYLRLAHRIPDWGGRTHFLHAAARAMRNILVSHARAKKSLKRGGNRTRVALEGLDLAVVPDDDAMTALDDALTALAAEDVRAATVVELRYFGGTNWESVAKAMNLTLNEVRREWTYAKAWLNHRLGLGEI